MATFTLDPSGSVELPVADWVNPSELRKDPYPSYARLRAESPVVWVPQVKKVLITSFAGVQFAEMHPEIFSANVSSGHMARALGGRPMLRKDGGEHRAERVPLNKPLRPQRIAEAYSPLFKANAARYLDALDDIGPLVADLNRDFAVPLAAKNLADMLGLHDIAPETVAEWSANLIAGIGNVLDSDEVWTRCEASRAAIDAHLDDLLPRLARASNHAIISMLQQGGMPDEAIRLNVKLTISGGMNEPQHALTAAASLLDDNPSVRERAVQDASLWDRIFEESLRLYSPIGMITRMSVAPTVLEGVAIPARTEIGLVLASANRDETAFPQSDMFDPARPARRQISFGSGDHMCAGRWAAEESIGRVALPELYRRFPELRVDPSRTTTWDGWVFRGCTSLPVTWS